MHSHFLAALAAQMKYGLTRLWSPQGAAARVVSLVTRLLSDHSWLMQRVDQNDNGVRGAAALQVDRLEQGQVLLRQALPLLVLVSRVTAPAHFFLREFPHGGGYHYGVKRVDVV